LGCAGCGQDGRKVADAGGPAGDDQQVGERYRFGVRGCTLPAQRYHLARILDQDELQGRLAAAVAACDARKGAAA
jgi:hypothetical protein